MSAAQIERAKRKKDEANVKILQELLSLTENQNCADCGERGPRWASVNLGAFLCIRCGGLHRKLGTHISKIKSITLDSWTPEQIELMKQWGNRRVNEKFLAGGSPPVPSNSDYDMEAYIRNKYEKRLFETAGGAAKLQDQALARDAQLYATQLKQLHSMGFSDDARNLSALKRTNGNINSAIDIVVSLASPTRTTAPSLPARPGSAQPQQQQPSPQRAGPTGFGSDQPPLPPRVDSASPAPNAAFVLDPPSSANRGNRARGTPTGNQQVQQQQQQPQQPQKSGQDEDLFGPFSNAGEDIFAPQPVSNAFPNTQQQAFTGNPSMPQQSQPKNSKESILSLFNAPTPQQPAFGMNMGQQQHFGMYQQQGMMHPQMMGMQMGMGVQPQSQQRMMMGSNNPFAYQQPQVQQQPQFQQQVPMQGYGIPQQQQQQQQQPSYVYASMQQNNPFATASMTPHATAAGIPRSSDSPFQLSNVNQPSIQHLQQGLQQPKPDLFEDLGPAFSVQRAGQSGGNNSQGSFF
ncbi:hypothetical protein BC832DRAFT_539459 [Gaertneriomyces semiglobifer]|nr:hypothetical protein BC832DRAFT_539459 [Gaertneriomyces semiglobifer]